MLCFSETSQSVAEDEGYIDFTLTLSQSLPMDLNITIITVDGTATGTYRTANLNANTCGLPIFWNL